MAYITFNSNFWYCRVKRLESDVRGERERRAKETVEKIWRRANVPSVLARCSRFRTCVPLPYHSEGARRGFCAEKKVVKKVVVAGFFTTFYASLGCKIRERHLRGRRHLYHFSWNTRRNLFSLPKICGSEKFFFAPLSVPLGIKYE